MATVRKRIGGGWKNIELPPTNDLNSNKIATESARVTNKEKNIDCENHEYSNRSGDNEKKYITKKSGEEYSSEIGDRSKVCINEDVERVENKWQIDEHENEKTKFKEMKKHSPKYSTAERKKEGSDAPLNDDVSVMAESDNTAKSDDNSSIHLPHIKHPGSVSDESGISSAKSLTNSKLSLDINYDDHPILRRVQDNVIGHDLIINTPYGSRKVTYCDYTASGRSLTFIEDFIRTSVIPTYANTHSTTGHNARQTGKYREEARNIIKRCVNANKDDVVVFTGSGATAGIHKIAWALKMNNPRTAAETAVFIGPYEHHSNILLWREFGTKVVRIHHNYHSGMIDLEHLKEELAFWKEKKRNLLVCMSAASNVTGIITDVDTVSRIAHHYGALAIFDYAGGGPYLKIDMNSSKQGYKDAVIVSPHKFVGGPGTPGVVIAKKWMFRNLVPDRVGGGTVRYVTREMHSYVGNIEEREEGGTPAIIESIRAGIVFKLKEEIGTGLIHAREQLLTRRAFAVWEENPCIFVLGSHTADRIPIFSFLTIHQETGRLIHHNFISTLLSDLYGIQARGGCACAGPYAEDLMGISESIAKKYLWFLSEKGKWNEPNEVLEIMKPGFTRINLPYFADDETVEFVIEAVDMVTKFGWKLLPQYSFDMKSGSWHHKSFSNTSASELLSLHHALNGTSQNIGHAQRENAQKSPSYKKILKTASSLFEEADKMYTKVRISSASLALRERLPRERRGLKWFLSPYEATNILADTNKQYLEKKPYRLPFKLEKPSFLADRDTDSDSQITSDMYRASEHSLSFPPIVHQRGRAVTNGYDSHKRHRSLNGRGTMSTEDFTRDIGKVSLEDGDSRRPTHAFRKWHEKNVIDSYGTPRGGGYVRGNGLMRKGRQ